VKHYFHIYAISQLDSHHKNITACHLNQQWNKVLTQILKSGKDMFYVTITFLKND